MSPSSCPRSADAFDLRPGKDEFRRAVIAGLCLLALCNAALVAVLASLPDGNRAPSAWLGGIALLLVDGGALAAIHGLQRLRRQLDTAHTERSRVQAMFDGLNGNTVIGIYMVDDAVRFTYANAQLAQMLGYDQRTLADHFPLDRIFPPRTYQDICRRASQRLSGEVARARYECPALRNDGTPIDVEVYGSRILLDGRPTIIGMMLDISERKRAEAVVWHQAHFDTLTRLPNRQSFQERLRADIRRSMEQGQSFALVFLDLDQFKEVNDSHGHGVGDELLLQVAGRLRACIGEADQLARLGGDEFTLILAAPATPDGTEAVCRRVLRSIAQPFVLHEHSVQISISAGITIFPQDGADGTTLLKHADLALYAAKNQGRNQFHRFSDTLRQAAQDRRELLQDLRAALLEQQFELFYQPVVDMRTGRTLKAEALIRWRHPRRGLVHPGDFIALAEESGLVVPIGEWVFETASRQLAQWRRDIQPSFMVGINVSPVQFQRDGMDPAAWIRSLDALGLPGSALIVEITEQVLMGTEEQVGSRLTQFHDAGIEVALDDFGTGYSSLAYLQRFDVDYLKIDRCFVSNLAPRSSDRILCQAIIAMSHQLGVKVIAEGIETPEQHGILQEIGCDYGQGYWHARPMTAPQLTARLLEESARPA